MRRLLRLLTLAMSLAVLAAVWPDSAFAQRARPRPSHRPVDRNAVVFIGGYFYDPFFGPYPWWGRGAYPYPYYPMFDGRGVIRVLATPKQAAVYVDGFYAGQVGDFDHWFQGLPVTPGGHDLTLYLEGYRTVHVPVYVSPGATVKLHRALEPLPPGDTSDPPAMAPPVPPPPSGSFIAPPRRANPS